MAEKIKYVYKNLKKKQCIEVPQRQQTYRNVGLFLIETLKHSNTILESILDLEKIKEGDSIYFKKKSVPKTC
jgi:hypothetical protein